MGTRSSLSAGSSIVAIGILLVPGIAAAQSAPAPGAGSQGPMIVERVKSGFLVEPEVKVTSFDHQTSELVGADAGWPTICSSRRRRLLDGVESPHTVSCIMVWCRVEHAC